MGPREDAHLHAVCVSPLYFKTIPWDSRVPGAKSHRMCLGRNSLFSSSILSCMYTDVQLLKLYVAKRQSCLGGQRLDMGLVWLPVHFEGPLWCWTKLGLWRKVGEPWTGSIYLGFIPTLQILVEGWLNKWIDVWWTDVWVDAKMKIWVKTAMHLHEPLKYAREREMSGGTWALPNILQ